MKPNIFQIVRLNELSNYESQIQLIDINVVDEDGQSLLHEAISHKNTNIGLDLIQRGINVNIQDRNGQTALHYAALYDNEALTISILNAGGSPNIKDKYGNDVLWTAVFNAKGKYNIVKLLKESGADSFSKNEAGRSPLDFAIQINDKDLCQILVGDNIYCTKK